MNARERFVELLKQIFEIDKADLDFGIYRILNIRREKIENFYTNELPKRIEEILAPFASANKDKERTDLEALETDVYSALYSFFNRYYEEGDFISKRRYKEGVYAIPYEGEEVKLYWANQDQYYIKTSENFKDYVFKDGDLTVHFKLVDATTEQNNNKEAEKRVFMLYEENDEFPAIKTFEYTEYQDEKTKKSYKELTIRFRYDIPKEKKKKYAEENLKQINKYISESKNTSILALARAVSNNDARSIIEKHLNAYVAKNTFDYFIHKDLGGFLRRELDFYIKSEIMHLDDLDTENEARVNTYLAKVRAIKRVGGVIIDFLAQLENFQKKLWLKKKFVVDTNWCITLDKIDEKFYPEIIANKAQVQEWVEMYAIDEIKGDAVSVAYSDPLTMDFLKQNQNLIVDTKHFSSEFKDRLVSSIEDLDKQCDGLLINSDNFQVLNLLKCKYLNKINAIYIDPPYNTVHSEILYKNQFKHSAWLSLINNTLPLVKYFFNKKEFSFGAAIDDFEYTNLSMLFTNTFPNLEKSTIVVNHHPQGAGGRLSRTHEYYMLLSDSQMPAYLGEPIEDHQEDRSFMRSGTSDNNYRHGRWKSFYALLYDSINNKIVGAEDPIPLGEQYPIEDTNEGYKRIYPINSKGEERVWRSSYLTGRKRAEDGELWVSEGGTVYQTIDHEDNRRVIFSNWIDSKYNAGTNGTNILKNMGIDFDYPKSIETLETGLWAQTYGNTHAIIMDFFAGSGTSGHAVINMNREYGGKRKYILAEMGEYFVKATLPRIKKVVYSSDWKDGKPQNRNTGISQIVKYMRLESYEDALSNITLQENSSMSKMIGDEYLIKYMLDIESKDSLLNLKAFTTPFDYEMKITEKNECVTRSVDVCETFNYLIGINVEMQSEIVYYNVKDVEDKKELLYEGAKPLDMDKNGKYGFRYIEGKLRDGRRALIIWRTIDENNLLESNAALDAYFTRHRINPQDRNYDVIYVNGDNNVENLRMDDESWNVVRIEQEFNKRMWEE